jgi:hypothetical protein
MSQYLRSLAQMVALAFLTPIAGMVTADGFNVLTFDWGGALTVGGSAAFATLIVGVLAKLSGDPEKPTF